jgi:hypothetical protein
VLSDPAQRSQQAGWAAHPQQLFEVVAFAAPLAWMQLRWGIWPGVVAHAASNAVLYHLLESGTVHRGDTDRFATESGLIYATVMAVGALAWWRYAPLVRQGAGTAAVVRRRSP